VYAKGSGASRRGHIGHLHILREAFEPNLQGDYQSPPVRLASILLTVERQPVLRGVLALPQPVSPGSGERPHNTCGRRRDIIWGENHNHDLLVLLGHIALIALSDKSTIRPDHSPRAPKNYRPSCWSRGLSSRSGCLSLCL